MEVAIIILLVLNLLLIAGTLFACLMVGSVVVQIMDVLSKLPDELRQPKKRDGQLPFSALQSIV
jgi:uncharacterized membrane protein YczE